MNKQPFFLTFALTFTLFTYLVGAPTKVNAGTVNITGASEDSTSSSGDNFNSGYLQPPFEPVPGVNVEFSRNGGLRISAEVQNTLNATVANRFCITSSGNSPCAMIIAILLHKLNAEAAANQLQVSIVSLGVSSSSVTSLVNALLGLAANKSASVLGVPVGQLQPVQLVASTKGLMADLVIAQKGETPNVNIEKLNDAITAYNKIVRESSPEVLQKLAKDPQFLEVGKLLKQLRAALNKS
ncbi:MAG: hypothetical protein V7K48_21295 [Nostoc sp.]|uniref:hypothetical protein n=1 Tax=Nostoc sp. TaxID=1180 RepID=UPI002FFB06FB